MTTQVVKALLDAGADPSILDANGRTPRDEASAGGHTDVVQALQGASDEWDAAAVLAREAPGAAELRAQPPAALGGGGGRRGAGARPGAGSGGNFGVFSRCPRLASVPHRRPAALLGRRPVGGLAIVAKQGAGLPTCVGRRQMLRPVLF